MLKSSSRAGPRKSLFNHSKLLKVRVIKLKRMQQHCELYWSVSSTIAQQKINDDDECLSS